jgi:large subunit ribosomal protein L18
MTKKVSNVRKSRIRYKLKAYNKQKLHRLSVFKSNGNIYAQVVNDLEGITVVSASTIDNELRSKLKQKGNCAAASKVGKLVAERAKKAGVEKVIFDRGVSKYHGRVKALADSARENGLSF